MRIVFARRSSAAVTAFGMLIAADPLQAQAQETLSMHGQVYSSACEPEKRDQRRQTILKSGAKHQSDASATIDLILCSSFRSVDSSLLARLVPKKVGMSTEGTGDEGSVETVNRDAELLAYIFADKKAGHANLQISKTNIVLDYYPNDACLKRVSLAFIRNSWVIRELGEACD